MKKSIEPNEKLVIKEVRFLNVVLYPESRQSPQRYAELFAKVFDLKIAVNTFAEKITQIESFDVDKDFTQFNEGTNIRNIFTFLNNVGCYF